MMDGVRHNRETEREQCIRRHHLFYLEPRHVRHAAIAAAVLPAVPVAADKRERERGVSAASDSFRRNSSELTCWASPSRGSRWSSCTAPWTRTVQRKKNLNFKNFNQNFISDGLFQTWSLSALIPARLLLESMRSIEHSSHISHLASVPIAEVTGELLCA